MNGAEAVQKIREREVATGRSRTAVFALSASVLETERNEVMAAGFDEFLHKPFREAELAAAMERHAGLRFRRADMKKALEVSQTPEAIMDQDPDWRDRLRTAVLMGDSDQALGLILEMEDPSKAEALRRMIEGYRFEELLKTLDKVEHDGGGPCPKS